MNIKDVKRIMYFVLLLIVYLIIMIALLAVGPSDAHKYGHAEGIYHLDKGERTGRIETTEPCYAGSHKQNKVVLYIDEDGNGIVEECATIWIEHGKMHYIRSLPNPDGVCECEGYIWLHSDE